MIASGAPWRRPGTSTTPTCFGRKTTGWPKDAGSPGASATHYPISNRAVHGADPRGRFALTSTGAGRQVLTCRWAPSSTARPATPWVADRAQWRLALAGGRVHTGCRRRPRPHGATRPPGRPASPTWRFSARPTPSTTGGSRSSPASPFETVPVAVALNARGFRGRRRRPHELRRAIRRPHEDDRRLPVIFNDYMNTLMGDPSTERLLPLIDAAAEVGAEYFCIDSGWYADLDESWWDTVGAWEPSTTRFPNGIGRGARPYQGRRAWCPGCGSSPRSSGCAARLPRAPAGGVLPADGRLVRARPVPSRLLSPGGVKHLDKVVDFLVGDLGVGYLKMDYNINVGPGPNSGGRARAPGCWRTTGRTWTGWTRSSTGIPASARELQLGRYAHRLRAAVPLPAPVHQRPAGPLRYPPIAAAAPAAIAPEQAAVWAYPQPGHRRRDRLRALRGDARPRPPFRSPRSHEREQRELVAEAVRVHKDLRGELAGALPFWPLGLPHWADPWIALGLRTSRVSYLTVWHRGQLGAGGAVTETDTVTETGTLPVGHLRGQPMTARCCTRARTGPVSPGMPPPAPCRCGFRASRRPVSSGSARSEHPSLRRRRHRRPSGPVHSRPRRPVRGRRGDRCLVRSEPGADELLRPDPDRRRPPVPRAVHPSRLRAPVGCRAAGHRPR